MNTKLESVFREHKKILLSLISDIHKLTESKYRSELDEIEKRLRTAKFITIPTVWEGISDFMNKVKDDINPNIKKILDKKWKMSIDQAEKLDKELDKE